MRREKRRIFVALCGAIFAAIFLHSIGATRFLERAVGRGLFFISEKAYRITEKSPADTLQTELKTAREEDDVTAITLNLLERENKDLREQLNFFVRHSYKHIGADIIGKSTEPFRQVLIVNRGANDTIHEGQAVVVKNGILLGKIIRVEEERSFVQLVSDYQSIIGAALVGGEHTIGIVEGGSGLSLRMGFIPQDQIINIGDTIVTSGLDTSIPRGLLIGKVAAVEKEPYEPFQRAIITPLAGVSSASVVSIILEQ
ncbi:MAG: rod shape-determining protein MreC [Patescibacteria group bacterium]